MMSDKRFKDEKSCSNCRNQMTGFDGGFFGLPFTCECRIYGETEGRKNCSDFEKKIQKSYLLDKIKELEKENDQLKEEYKIAVEEMVTDYKKLEKENEELRKDVENLQEVVAELGATLLMNGFEIEINDENLSEMIYNG